MSNFSIQDESHFKYFALIPYIIVEIGLKSSEISMYLAIKKSAGENGECTKSTAKLAKEAGINKKTLFKVLDKLCETNSFLKKPLISCCSRITESGDKDTNLIKIINIWPENIAFFDSRGGVKTVQPRVKKDQPGVKKEQRLTQKRYKGGVKTVHKEEPFKKNLYEEDITPSIPNGEFVCFGSFVKLKKEEYENLSSIYGKLIIEDLIDQMNDYCAASQTNGYKDYAAALRQWIRRRKQDIQKPTVDRRTKNKDGTPVTSRVERLF